MGKIELSIGRYSGELSKRLLSVPRSNLIGHVQLGHNSSAKSASRVIDSLVSFEGRRHIAEAEPYIDVFVEVLGPGR